MPILRFHWDFLGPDAQLDIFGRASLFHLLETVSTHMGEATLTRWLSQPAAPPEVHHRQSAVAELAPLIDLRDELSLRGRLMGDPDRTKAGRVVEAMLQMDKIDIAGLERAAAA